MLYLKTLQMTPSCTVLTVYLDIVLLDELESSSLGLFVQQLVKINQPIGRQMEC